MTAIKIDSISKSFGSSAVLDSVSLEIPSGELFFYSDHPVAAKRPYLE